MIGKSEGLALLSTAAGEERVGSDSFNEDREL
jgi:hypothetical protein